VVESDEVAKFGIEGGRREGNMFEARLALNWE
jgi:hypothetical protein